MEIDPSPSINPAAYATTSRSGARAQTGHVFEDNDSRLEDLDPTQDVGPDPSVVFRAEPLSCDADWRTREARRDDVHQSTKARPGEVCEIACENRRRLQGRVFHPLQEEGRGAGFPLDVAQNTQSAEGDVNAEIEHPDAAAQAESMEDGTIHIIRGAYPNRFR